MNTTIRTRVLPLLVMTSLCGCGTVASVTSSAVSSVVDFTGRILSPKPSQPPTAAPPSPTLDAYKTEVAQQVVRHNPERVFSGRLPDMLPAIVVVNVTVDKDGRVKEVEVQRSRDPDAAKVALDSMRRSEPLPKPANLLVSNSDSVTFSETFLFDAQYRFQLRSLAGPQSQ